MNTQVLMQAAINGDEATLALLISSGFDLNAVDENGRTAAHYVVEAESSLRHRRFLKTLISKGVNLDVIDTNGDTPLLVVAQNYPNDTGSTKLPMMKALVKAGCDSNVKASATGYTAAMYMIEQDAAALDFLVKSGADVNVADIRGDTLLAKAIYYDFIPELKMIINAGADINHVNNEGQSIRDIAELDVSKGSYKLITAHLDRELLNKAVQSALVMTQTATPVRRNRL